MLKIICDFKFIEGTFQAFYKGTDEPIKSYVQAEIYNPEDSLTLDYFAKSRLSFLTAIFRKKILSKRKAKEDAILKGSCLIEVEDDE